ncbi:MAG: pyrroloquinoline quinone-dependent dehydrogenase [Alphaproteobacteria bacterium]|nr:pyrroloquinoline quinone-dependent dehydrogenase [Alphaproteobacteria bacterium]
MIRSLGGFGLAIAFVGTTVAQDWPAYGGADGGGQYSPHAQIRDINVAKLKPVWTFHSGDVSQPESPAGGSSFLATPIHANDHLYFCTPLGRIIALDPATGAETWQFDPHASLIDDPRLAMNCRGVAYWQAGEPEFGKVCQKRVFRSDFTSSGAHLYSVDADTGRPCMDFGAARGQGGMVAFAAFDWKGKGAVFPTSAPVVIDDLVIVGTGVGDNIDADAPDGIVRAFDVRSGEERWAFNPIPPELSDKTGGANVWAPFSADPERGLVFLPTTSPSVDPYGGLRTADVPIANSIVALKAATGEIAWHFQTVRHDLFDYDLPAQPILADLTRNDVKTPVVIQTAKTGLTFVFNRETGEPWWPIGNPEVPQTDVPGETSSRTQPVPVLPEPFARQDLTRDELFGLTPLDRMACQRKFDAARYEGLFTPPSLKGSIIFPSMLGGGNWGGAAFDPRLNLLIVKSENLATYVKLVAKQPGEVDREVNLVDFLNQPLKGTPYRMEGDMFLSPLGIPCTPPPWGTLTAIDMTSGKVKWQMPLGRIEKWGIPLPKSWGSPNVGGPLVTAGNLIFVGATMDSRFRALSIADGKELWSAELPAPGMAVPMSYVAGGQQFVVIAAGGNARVGTALSDALVAFALPQ